MKTLPSYPLRTKAARVSGAGGSQLSHSLRIALRQRTASSKMIHPRQGQPMTNDWLMQGTKARSIASIQDSSEGRSQFQSFLKAPLRALLCLYQSSAPLSAQYCFLHSPTIGVFKNTPLGNSLALQWLGLYTSTAGGTGSSLVRELRSRKPHGVVKKKNVRTLP